MAIPIVITVSDMISLVEQINTVLRFGILRLAIEIWNTFFSMRIKEEDQKQLTLMWDRQYILTVLGAMLNVS